MDRILLIDILLSCGHINNIEIEAVIFQPKIGDECICSVCKHRAKVQNVGVAWWDGLDEPVEKLPGQKSLNGRSR